MQDNPDVNFGFLVSDVARLLREKFNATAQKLGLTLAQARVLAHLSRNEGINQVALSAFLEVQPITMLRQIDRLEKAGLVERRAHPTDRRMQQLYLTPLSQPLLQQIFDVGRDLQGEVMDGLSEAARSQLVTTLAHIRSNLSQPQRGAEPGAPTAREIGDV